MAAVTRIRGRLATPSGEARIRRGLATVAIEAGQAVCVDGAAAPGTYQETAWRLAANAGEAIGLAIKDAAVNATVEVVIDGEVGGFSGLPKGQYLSVVAGALDDTAPTVTGTSATGGATSAPATSRFYAYSDTVVMVL